MVSEHFFHVRYYAAREALINGSERRAAEKFGISRRIVRYWKQKIIKKNFHEKNLGGVRKTKYNALEMYLLKFLLEFVMKTVPSTTLSGYVN